jgi:hypothetical protein
MSLDAPDRVEEIEITPEMIEAGATVLQKDLGGAVEVFWSPHDLAVEVYRAMRALDHPS